jgi:hypothetical protein
MHSAPELAYVGNGLKADVTGKGAKVERWRTVSVLPVTLTYCKAVLAVHNGKTFKRSRRVTVLPCQSALSIRASY